MEQLETCVTLINDIFKKNPGRFITLNDITERRLKIEHIMPALEKMIQRGQIEYDQAYGYCRKGEKENLLRNMSNRQSPVRAMINRHVIRKRHNIIPGGKL